jgi:two-component system CheB/CheR fusion protein
VKEAGFEALLDHIRRSRGFDFTGYKPPSLRRRIGKRMEAVGVDEPAAYIDYLEVHPEEFALLFNTILINVTSFFRDPAAWRYLREHAVPELLEKKGNEGPIRVWSAGTASGEEAYSLAMVLADALGEEAFAERVKIYATDVDEDALTDARHGIYPLKAADDIPDDLAARFLERTDHRFTFPRDLRRRVIFGRNDLVQDAPISRIDILACRNTLMYFTAETQARILSRFHFALNDQGVLFLGKSEMLLTHAALFNPLDLKCRVFAKVARPRARRVAFPAVELDPPVETVVPAENPTLHDLTLESGPVAQVVVDAEGCLAVANREARRLFSLERADIGRRFQDLELSYRPVELRSAIEEALAQGAPVSFPDVRWSRGEEVERRLEISVASLQLGPASLGAMISFKDVTAERSLQDDLERSRRELEVAYEELQSTVEELETTNEELQSTNEELETTNEELQSTNEELETMNEELQSTNEELETTNDELRQRTTELNGLNNLLETTMAALGLAVIAVNEEGVVRLWNDRSEDLWGLRAGEAVGQHLLGLDIGLPVEQLRAPLRRALAGDADGTEVELDATNRRGRPVRLRVGLRPLHGPAQAVTGSVVLMEELGRASGGDGADSAGG